MIFLVHGCTIKSKFGRFSNNNKSAQSNLGTEPRRGGLSGPWAVQHCAMACIHVCASCPAAAAAAVSAPRATSFCCVHLSFGRRIVIFCQFLIYPDVNLQTEYIVKKPTNRAFQRYVCRTEMLSSFRIRVGNISPPAT